MTLDQIEQLIRTQTPQQLFGADPEAKLREFQVLFHPDKFPGDIARATAIMQQLSGLAHKLREPVPPPVVIKSPQRTYCLATRLAVGDVSDVYQVNQADGEYIVKVSRIPGGATLLAREHAVLADLMDLRAEAPVFSKLLPPLVESFPIRDRFPKRVNVFAAVPGLHSLVQIRQQYPDGVDGRHIAWMFNRVLAVLAYAHGRSCLHAAVTPQHLLYSAADHGLRLVGWGHSITGGSRIAVIPEAYRSWYPPEVFRKEPPTPSVDLYMAARCMVYAAGGDDPGDPRSAKLMPASMQRFFQTCLFAAPPMRPHAAWGLLEDFGKLLTDLYGKRKFHPLVMT